MDILANLSDIETLGLTLYGEARSEPVEGQIAIANVIYNRSVDRKKTVKEICLQPYQFSCWNQNDPNRALLMELGSQLIIGEIPNGVIIQCLFIADGMINKKFLDNTRRASYYMEKSLFYSPGRPKWASVPKAEPKLIGNHVFFNV